jgi:hypothetical protein
MGYLLVIRASMAAIILLQLFQGCFWVSVCWPLDCFETSTVFAGIADVIIDAAAYLMVRMPS